MKLTEENKDIFELGDDYVFAHCISRDCKMGAGIAVPMKQRFHLDGLVVGPHPCCVYRDGCYSLVTKAKYYHKPNYGDLRSAILMMRDDAVQRGVKKIAMPRIGCGLDGLAWEYVRADILEAFKDTDVEILVCSQPKSIS